MKRKLFVLGGLILGALLGASRDSGAAVGSWNVLLAGDCRAVASAPPATAGAVNELYAAMGPPTIGIQKSVDGGITWTPLAQSIDAYALAADTKTPGTVYAAATAGILRTVDFGATWQIIRPGANGFILVSPVDSRVLHCGGARSIDGGATWATTNLPIGIPGTTDWGHIKASATVPNTLYAYGNSWNTTLRSTDGGLTYSSWGPGGKMDSVEVDPVDGQTVFIGGCGNISYRYTPAAGFQSVGLGGHLHGFVVDPTAHDKVYAFGETDANVFRSTNNGQAFSAWSTGFGSGLIREGRMIFDGTNGRIYVPKSTGLSVVDTWPPATCLDADIDGYYAQEGCGTPVDCNDNDPLVHPGAAEVCGGGADDNCNGLTDCADPACPGTPPCCTDADSDGYARDGMGCGPVDCNDANPAVCPGCPEVLFDTVDQDCNGYDLTIRVTVATWSARRKSLSVQATSSYAAAATLLAAAGTPPGTPVGMTWNEKKKLWSATIAGVAVNPVNVTVSGPEGAVTAPVTEVR